MTVDELNTLIFFSDGEVPSDAYALAEIRDADIVEGDDAPLCKCGNKRRYVSVFNAGSYRAFAVCDECDDASEF